MSRVSVSHVNKLNEQVCMCNAHMAIARCFGMGGGPENSIPIGVALSESLANTDYMIYYVNHSSHLILCDTQMTRRTAINTTNLNNELEPCNMIVTQTWSMYIIVRVRL